MGQKKVSVLVKSGVKLHARTVLGGKREVETVEVERHSDRGEKVYSRIVRFLHYYVCPNSIREYITH